MPDLDALDKALLSAAQTGFPLCTRPYQALGEGLGLSEGDVLARFRRLKAFGILRQLSAIFDSKALGYGSVLVAARVAGPGLERAAGIVSGHPGVSHNYEREHSYNLWFTLATPPGAEVEVEAARLCERAGAEAWRVLPSLRTFRIGVTLDLRQSPGLQRHSEAAAPRKRSVAQLTEEDREMIRVLQEDLPLIARPFEAWAARSERSEAELFDWMAQAGSRGFLRRFAAVIKHRQAGFSANAMGVWALPEDRVEEAGLAFAAYAAVTHCYQRPTFQDWPYNLFTMVHGKERADCESVLEAMAREVQPLERAILYSTREFKKARVRYFNEQLTPEPWQDLAQAAQANGLT